MSLVRNVTRRVWVVTRHARWPALQCRKCLATWGANRFPRHHAGCLAAEVRLTPRPETAR